MSKVNQAAGLAIKRALIWDSRVRCLDRWASEVTDRSGKYPEYRELRDRMTETALDSWRDAMMWGLLSDAVKAEIKQEVANRFLSMDGPGKKSVMHHLTASGQSPGSWSSDVEKQFRDEIRALLGVEPE